MSSGIVSVRYAKALLEYSKETGNLEKVFQQVKALLEHPETVSSKLEPELQRFVKLLLKNHRLGGLKFILRSFLVMYYEYKGLKRVHLTIVDPFPELEQKLQSAFEQKLCSKVLLDSVVDPSIVGGFVLRVDGYMLDASVKGQLEQMKKQFIKKHNRIV